ncbi:MAG: hypothetical protein WCD79_16520 [Chthoniobacteraceae bacterium]
MKWIIHVLLLLLFSLLTSRASPILTLLDGTSGENGRPTGVSSDGSVVVGNTTGDSGAHMYQIYPVIWTNGTMEYVEGPSSGASLNGVSASGSIIVAAAGGHYDYNPSTPSYPNDYGTTPAYLTHSPAQVNTEMSLGFLGYAPQTPYAGSLVYAPGTVNAVSADGSTMVGSYDSQASLTYISGTETAALWNSSGYTNLGVLSGSGNAAATAASANGSVIVGWSAAVGGTPLAFRWTSATGMTSLGLLPNGTNSAATGISGDGSVIVGNADGNAVCWTNTVIGKLGTIGNYPATANAISSDGRLIGGAEENGNPGGYAYSWNAYFWWDGQVYNLGSYLSSILGGTQGYQFDQITAISGDLTHGYNIAGYLSGDSRLGNAFLITGFYPPGAAAPVPASSSWSLLITFAGICTVGFRVLTRKRASSLGVAAL